MSYETHDSFFGFPFLICLRFLAFLPFSPWLIIKLRLTIQPIAKGSYMTISTTMVTSLCRVLVTSMLRVHMSNMKLRYVIHHLKPNLFLR